ncbi:hypothetical protein AJ79_05969 [Helicocarpus griseus UAMH5409]|uniref:Zn(2)-C6 fungal-type domain-containing protein n=1 Tax=Helicocarpus griseus UAMH5409 TaxID=1447875 RepID=A0A2B7XHT8_9EURO|nr:hypothetical protein AJ79_05969 [Helicocarpus griseus UAMH5409]
MSFSDSLQLTDTNQELFAFAEWLLPSHNNSMERHDSTKSQSVTVSSTKTGPEIEFRARQRVSLACLPCRNRHVKCDSGLPTCSRCKFEGRKCKYMQSRRGGHNKIISRDIRAPCTRPPSTAPEFNHSSSLGERTNRPMDDSDSAEAAGGRANLGSPASNNSTAADRPLECYYSFFHDPHPMVLPKQQFMVRMEANGKSLEAVAAVMRYIGSLCGQYPSPDSFKSLSDNLLFSTQLPKNGFSVQALMLCSIATHWNNDKVRAREILDIASSLALDIGMHSRHFAYQHGEGSPILEESWRRTWWLLYVVDSLYAGIRHAPNFALWSVDTDVELPCEEEEFRSGNIPKPRTLIEFDHREFDAVDMVFSSFAYLIDAARILGTALAIGSNDGNPVDPAVDHADSGLVAWSLHLPDSKKEPVTEKGKVDPILFLAHMLIQTTKIYLHRPRSKLLYNSAESISKCAPPPPPEQLNNATQEAYQLHTIKVLTAAEKISKLLSLPTR